MIHASDFLDYNKLPSLVEAGLLTKREHPDTSIYIYNYTARCQYEAAWAPETLNCRGLILDASGNVLARPFQKFFNLQEHQSSRLPDLPLGQPFEAFEKLDGSLGIAYRNPISGDVEIATRGAFASDQANWATDWWADHHGYTEIPDDQTWLFEIIYPENRIVVNYGNRRELVLLAVIDNATGRDLPIPESWTGAVASRFDQDTVDALVASVHEPQNFEGFVLRYPSTGQRVKVKLDEYVRLHRVLTQCSSRDIWELLSSGQGLGSIIDRVPDEFYRWVNRQSSDLLRSYRDIDTSCRNALPALTVEGDRKATAENFKRHPYPAVLFKLLDGKDPAPLIWKMIRPEYAKPFVVQPETSA